MRRLADEYADEEKLMTAAEDVGDAEAEGMQRRG